MIIKQTVTDDFFNEFNSLTEFVNRNIQDLYSNRPDNIPLRLWECMFYSLNAGGKRLRPVLCLKSAETFGLSREEAIPMALGLEMIHTASLIHDDLPCMDNDSLRRGKPTNHIVFGEALSLLAGTSLFLFGIEYPSMILSKSKIHNDCIFNAISVLTKHAGATGIHGGQVLDTDRESQRNDPEFVWDIASMKTAALIQASVETGAILASAETDKVSILKEYGKHLGLAFQIVDDMLDIKGNSSELGKTTGKDLEQNKITFVKNYGYEKAKDFAVMESDSALACALDLFNEKNNFFSQLALYLQSRTS